MKPLLLLQLYIIFVQFQSVFATKGYKIRQYKILCFNFNDPRFRKERCEIKPARGTGGLLNIVIHYKGLNELQCNFRMYHRNTLGKYQPYLINVMLDACEKESSKWGGGDEIKKRVYKVFDSFDPNFKNGCPLVGPMNVSNWDFDKESEKFYPPVMAGLYIIRMSF